MRKIWRQIHLWIGLICGIVLVVIGLSGSLLVFYRTLEEQIYPDIMLSQGAGTSITEGQALESIHKAYPDKKLLGIMPPRHDKAVFIAFHVFADEAQKPAYGFFTVDQYSGKVLGEQVYGKTVMTFIYLLHYTLTFGPMGALVVGFIGIFFFISLCSGLYLWWPKGGKWKQALTFKKNASAHRRNFDIHRVFGFYPFVILITLAFSGVYMIFPQQTKWVVGKMLTIEEDTHDELTSAGAKGRKRISYEEAVSIGKKALPGQVLKNVGLPADEKGTFHVSFNDGRQPMSSYGYNEVVIDQYTGEVLHVRLWKDAAAGDTFLGWQFPLHNGEAFGLVGRWVIFFSGFLPLILFTTGVLMWLKRRKA